MSDYDRIAGAIDYIVANADAQPGLAEIAAEVSLSPYHFQRVFARWVGLSPKRFLEVITVERAKRLLAMNDLPLLAASETLGLSSSSRLHDHFVRLEAVTPGEFRTAGEGLSIRYGVAASPFGRAFVAATARGICSLAFIDGEFGTEGESAADGESDAVRGPGIDGDSGAGGDNGAGSDPGAGNDPGDAALEALASAWPRAALVADAAEAARIAALVFGRHTAGSAPISVHVRGTNFQIAVWRALLAIPEGRLVSYGDVARAVGRPAAVRAVGTAVGANPCAFLIPCHRVIRGNGELGGYRWGPTRKQAINIWEAAATGGMLPGC